MQYQTITTGKARSARKDGGGKKLKGTLNNSKTPTTVKSRKVMQKENKEVNTTERVIKKKSALKMHLMKGEGPLMRNLESCDMSQITGLTPW